MSDALAIIPRPRGGASPKPVHIAPEVADENLPRQLQEAPTMRALRERRTYDQARRGACDQSARYLRPALWRPDVPVVEFGSTRVAGNEEGL